ncbi:hypothetical protein BUALT_Bualt18G0120100 [Buddleja alternifolia]|uniref:Uncharacterized protein n=1 Tax=Buddleja alternifolia TaxID=168488 RepID=A0AAV6W4W9_9LAMI|nr:hypothetical protein BUALT_Bualt18G0120100 [Buddleja alternifolia]
MASSDEIPGLMPPGDGSVPPGKPMTVAQHIIDKGAQMMQSLKPIKKMSQHVCTFAAYSHDMARQIETHHYVSRLNQDFLQCAVYDSDDSTARLIGVEYIVSERIFETLPPEEQKLWHSHGDRLPLGVPALMMSPQGAHMVKPDLIQTRDEKYKIFCDELRKSRVDISLPDRTVNTHADYWMETGKGFAIDVENTDMKLITPFP